jgi:tripartite-type tricarboxylate transporter receptor subunit TctC
MSFKHLAAGAVALSTLIGFAWSASAQENYPERPISLVVPYAAGGSTDVSARIFANAMSRVLGQPVVVENRPGGTGNVGGSYVANAAPDGYTLFFAVSTQLAANPAVFRELAYDPIESFEPISQTAIVRTGLVVHPDVPANDVPELIEYLKANPGEVNYGSGGAGSSQHASAALFEALTGTEMVHVTYQGGAPAMNDMLAGQIQVLITPIVEALAQIEADRVKLLAVAAAEPSPLFPDTPAIGDTVEGFDITIWNGIVAPKGTPEPIIAKLADAVLQVAQDPDLQAELSPLAIEPSAAGPEAFRDFIAAEIDRWAEIIEIAGATDSQ